MSGMRVGEGSAWVHRPSMDQVAARYAAMTARNVSALNDHAARADVRAALTPNAPSRPPARPGSTFDTYA